MFRNMRDFSSFLFQPKKIHSNLHFCNLKLISNIISAFLIHRYFDWCFLYIFIASSRLKKFHVHSHGIFLILFTSWISRKLRFFQVSFLVECMSNADIHESMWFDKWPKEKRGGKNMRSSCGESSTSDMPSGIINWPFRDSFLSSIETVTNHKKSEWLKEATCDKFRTEHYCI